MSLGVRKSIRPVENSTSILLCLFLKDNHLWLVLAALMQHTLVTLSSQGQSQGHQGHFRFLADFTRFSYLLQFLLEDDNMHRNVPLEKTKKL